MSKKRPSKMRPHVPVRAAALSKMEPAYWRERLFKNTFTYRGRPQEVRGWAVKLQLYGRRKTFSLRAGDPLQAAAEACQLYRNLAAFGWAAVLARRAEGHPEKAATHPPAEPPAIHLESELAYWQGRLLHRRYPEARSGERPRTLSARIDVAGAGWYMPLGTADEVLAARRAREIQQAVIAEGWRAVNQKYPRELTLALRWLEAPLAWTYTSIHTVTKRQPPATARKVAAARKGLRVVLIEADRGIRLALADCLNAQEGFGCAAAFATVAEALRELPRLRADFLIANQSFPGAKEAGELEDFLRRNPVLAAVTYSVFEDSDHVFKSTPGGAMGYMLKRTPPFRLLELLAGLPKPVTRERVMARVREYFQQLPAAIPSQVPVRELSRLTPREHEILALLSKGDVAKEIADRLGISVWTVHGHVKSIFEKLGVHTRIEAVVKFLQK